MESLTRSIRIAPQVLKILWKLVSATWKNQLIPLEWQRAVAVFISKEQESHNISQFRSIALLNVIGESFLCSHGQEIDILSHRKWLH